MKTVYRTFIAVSALLYGVIFAGQVLGILGIYWGYLAIPVAIGVFLLTVFIAWSRPVLDFSCQLDLKPLSLGLYIAGSVILLLLILIPLIHWPFSPISETLQWDAGLYHFPKAIEMFHTGSAWDMTLSYAQYPFGYESLLSFALCLTGNEILFGTVHALIAFYLFMAVWLLTCRYTRLNPALLYFLTAAMLLSGVLPLKSNIWWILKYLIYTIGKNDVFVGAALLGCILTAPVYVHQIAQKNAGQTYDLLGMAVQTMIALSIKPNTFPVLVFLWGWTGIELLRRNRELKRGRWLELLKQFSVSLAVIFPGVFWVIRNAIALHSLGTADLQEVQSWSIFYHLFDSRFYNHIPSQLIIIVGILIMAIIGSLIFHLPGWRITLVFILLIIGFAITPASAFSASNQERAEIAWRFAVALLAYSFVILLVIISPPVARVYQWVAQRLKLQIGVALIPLCFSFWMVWDQQSLLEIIPKNNIVLSDYFREPVGINGYNSAYDYVQKNIHHSVIYVENGLPFYVYDAGFTNTTTRSLKADYWVIFRMDDQKYPDDIATADWEKNWMLIYEDREGRVYQRK